jgi:hypothetical protein
MNRRPLEESRIFSAIIGNDSTPVIEVQLEF